MFRARLGAEVTGHHQEQLTQTLIGKSQQNKIELVTRSDILQLLEDRGHEVLHVQPSIITEAAMKFPTHILADEGKTLLRLWEGDLVDPSVLTTSVVYKVSMNIFDKI